MLKFPPATLTRSLASAALILFVFAATAGAQSEAFKKEWESFDYAAKQIRREQLKDLTLEDLKLMRGIVFGRHGRVFKDWDIGLYLREQKWYKPDPNFNNSSLNETERRNLDLIREFEAKLHETIEPGDMRWWQTRRILPKNLGEHTAAEWRILRAEIEAIHGKRFDDQPWLQNYFEERYWYQPKDSYDPRQLTDIERRNMTAIDAAQKKQRNAAVSPGDMEHFQKTALSEEMLRGLGLYELRLLRNEIYARRGRQFRTEWIAQHFYSQLWYEPREDMTEPELSEIERKNVETIVKYENALHEELATKPVSKALLEGMFLEDARKLRQEIYARRGKVFKDRWLQKYFESFSWYKPDPKYKDATLSAVERQNVSTILAYEKKATSVLDAIEG
jgi:hypothetical protein